MTRVAVYTVLTMWFMLSIWCIDVSITMLNLGVLTNGFWVLSPTVGYHIGLYSAILAFVSLIFYSDFIGRK